MAQATVTLKVSPYELQLIKESLRQYEWAMRTLLWEDKEHRKRVQPSLAVFEGDTRTIALAAQQLLKDIGLK